MSDIFSADPAALRNIAPGFEAVAASVRHANSELSGRIGAEGECWGADETGESFASSYSSDVQPTLEAIDKLAQVLSSLSDRVTRMADAFEQTDHTSSENIGGVI